MSGLTDRGGTMRVSGGNVARDRARWTIVVLAGGAAMLSAGVSRAQELPVEVSLSYEIRTTLRDDPVRATPAVLVVPTPVDVDGDLTPDLLVQLTIDAGRAHLRALRVPGATGDLPVRLEAVLADPRAGSSYKVGFGYDARASKAPDDFEGSLTLITDAQRLGSFALDVATVRPGESLAIIAALFEEAPDGARTDPLSARVDLSPVPTAIHGGLLLGSDLGVTTSRLDMVTNIPTRLDVLGRDIRGQRESRLELTLDRLPNSVSLSMTDTPAGRSFDYTATTRISAVEARLSELQGGSTLEEAFLRFEDMPGTVRFTQASDQQGTLEAPGIIGAIELGAHSGGPLVTLDEPSYVAVSSVGSHDSVAVRLSKVSRAEYDTRDPSVFALTSQPGPFVVKVVDGARVIDARIIDLPSDMRFTLSEADSRITFEGSARILHIDVDAFDPDGIAGEATTLQVDLLDVPTVMDLVYDASGGEVALSACPDGDPNACVGRPLGVLQVSAHSGVPVSVPAGQDGVVFEDTPGTYALAARLTSLRKVGLSEAGAATQLELHKAAGPFIVSLTEGAREIDIEVNDLPSSITATFDPAGTLSYSASAGIASLTGSIVDPSGVSGRATRADVTLSSLPATLALTWSSDSGLVGADAGGGTVGMLEFLLTSGPVETLPADRDGVLLRDLTDRYVVFGRLTGLKKISATLDPPDVTIETLGGRVLVLDMEEQAGASVEHTRVTLDRLTPSVRISFAEDGSRRDIAYSATAATNSLTLDTNSGDRGNLHVSIGAPLPASITFCAAENLACTPAGDRGGRGEADAGSVRLAASEHTTVNMLDCVRPLSGCTRSNASEYTAVDDLRVRVMGFDADSNDPVGYSGHIYLDTDDHSLTGRVINIAGDGGFEANFPAGFHSQNRLGKWTFWGLDKDKSGSISCPGGTGLDVRVIGIWLGVTSYLC